MQVGIFYNSIRNPVKFANKVQLMDNFKTGVLAVGDHVIEYHDGDLPVQQLDAGFVLGYTLENNFRKRIIDHLSTHAITPVFVDSNILHYARKQHEWHRYSLNTVYPDSGTYFFGELDKSKWQTFSTWHEASLQPWRTTGDHVMILCQRPNGFNMFTDQESWLDQTIAKIQQHTSRPIVIRMHPGDGSRFDQIQKIQKKYRNLVTISTHDNIRDALMNCWCTVGYNSTPNVVSAIEGVPGYVEDPAHSWAADVAFRDLSQIETPPLPDRSDWINRIANIHWSNDEVRSGKLWSAIKKYICASR